MADIFNNISFKWKTGTWLLKLLFINIAVFLLLRIGALVCFFAGMSELTFLNWVECPSSFAMLATRPWTIITYMFAQFDVLHILFNMLWLYGFGRMFLEFNSQKQLLALYIYGGIAGALLFMVGYSVLPVFSGISGWLIGSSGAVIAIVIATATLNPNHKVGLLFIGQVSLKWIAIVSLAIFVLSLSGENSGGHMAHLGGAAIGALYGLMMRRGIDITKPFNKMLDGCVNLSNAIREFKLPKPSKAAKPKASKWQSAQQTSTKSNTKSTATPEDQAELDKILDKIKKSGYTALSADEKKRLFDVSSRIK